MKVLPLLVFFAALSWNVSESLPSSGDLKTESNAEAINWMSWDEAVQANETEKRKIIVDVYTDWCGWCKRMDAGAFRQAEVVEYINSHFYPVKLNAETTQEFHFKGHTFKYLESGRRGVNELAYSLLDGQLSYPSIVYLNENFERVSISPGFKESPRLMQELRFVKEEIYNQKTWEAYIKNQ